MKILMNALMIIMKMEIAKITMITKSIQKIIIIIYTYLWIIYKIIFKNERGIGNGSDRCN